MSERRRRTAAPRALLAALLSVVALLLPATAMAVDKAAANAVAVPPSVTAPLGVDKQPAVVPYAELIAAAETGRINAAVVDTANYWVAAVDDKGALVAAVVPRPDPGEFADDAKTTLPGPFGLADALREDGVAVLRPAGLIANAPSTSARLISAFAFPVGILVIFGTILIVMRLVRGPGSTSLRGRKGGNPHGKIRKNAKVEPPPVRFGDVAGCDEAVEELQEVVVFLRDPERFRRVGAKMPKGVILHGPPGTGKTLLAKAVAGEAGVPFYALSGSDFVDTYVGVGASRVRDLFSEARAEEDGAIIFFDEIDAIGRARGGGGTGAESEREATLNQLLVELDGFGARDRVVIIAATNRVDMLDQALTRPGRFDRRVQVGVPAEAGRLSILKLHSAHMPIADPASLEGLARVTAGFAGADLANILNEAAIMAARDDRELITSDDLDEGMLRAVAGPRKKDRRIAEGEIDVIAWHEAGHVLAAELCPTHVKAHRVTIHARSDAGGLALYGNQDRALTSQQHLHERMVVALAGRAAEQIGFGHISSGAANDLQVVNGMAREAVERLGFSPRVGQIMIANGPMGSTQVSDEVRRMIDEEMGRMVDAAYADAVALLEDHREELAGLANALLRREQLDRPEIEAVIAGFPAAVGRRGPTRVDALPVSRPAPAPAPQPEPAVLAHPPVHVEPPAPALPVPVAAQAPAFDDDEDDEPVRGRRRSLPRFPAIRAGVSAAVEAMAAHERTRRRRRSVMAMRTGATRRPSKI
ncbi:MAG: cell division protease FtsH [Miltoncostaeaceae bacterium]|jgi:cell division protease FtsH|nr:cell division protease FtsH [Miltoncostaeaceae bacterium]